MTEPAHGATIKGRTIRFGLAAKLAICLSAGTLAIFALFGQLTVELQRREARDLIITSADRVTDIIRRSTRYQMLHNDREALYQVIRDIGSEPGIVRVRIFNQSGQISVSTDAEEVGKVVDKSGEACYACHAQSQPLTKLNRPDRARTFTDSGKRVLGVIRPIENEQSCWSAACHAHPESQKILGVIDANLSLEAVDAQTAEHRALLLRWMAVVIVLALIVSLAFIWTVVHRPVNELMAGTRRVADGDLDYRLEVRSADELGELAHEFNLMTEQLADAHAKILARAETLEEHVERKTKELERTQTVLIGSEKYASLGKLAATVAHEVNNPLFGILTYARLSRKELEKSGLPEDRMQSIDEQLQVIERESRRCGEIMRNLLTFARQAPPRRENARLEELVERAVKLVRHQLELQSITLETTYDKDLPGVFCDPNQIQQAVLVLLVNAYEAMQNGGSLEVGTAKSAEGKVAIRVKDTGGGIPASVLESIFEPFFTTKDHQHRTGLGLAVARSIIERHEGAIEVDTEPGKGTEFRIVLPVGAREPALAEEKLS